MKNNNCDELYVSLLFPPVGYTSGITVLKRIIESGNVVDVMHAKSNSSFYSDFSKITKKYINNHIEVDIDCYNDWSNCIFQFIKKGMKLIKNDYKRLYSRSWLMSNHFLAAEYKFASPNTVWRAEFSDPLIYDLSNNIKRYKEMIIDNKKYIKKINNKIHDYNKQNNTTFDLIKNKSSAYFICEYLCYLFADKVIFTNENQREIMLNQFPINIKEHIINKTEIKPHPILPNSYYYLNKTNLNLNKNFINIAYFGNEYYGKRHFESIFYAFESINHKYKDKIKFYFFINDDKLLQKLINPLSNNFLIKKPLNYIDFLNATTQFDILIVNDLQTQDSFQINPYLPSKLSDYLGSNTDIWALYEKGSTLSKLNFKYKSNMFNFDECRDVLINVLNDNDFCDESWSSNDDYLFKRLTSLNEIYEEEYRQKEKYKHKFQDVTSSNSWKLTKPLRNLRK